MDFSAITAIAIPEGNVVQIEAGGEVLWKSGPLPAAYQQVEWIRNTPGSTTTGQYLDLGFAFDTAATIYLHYRQETGSAYIFGAAESSGKYRCMITGTTTDEMFYGSNGSAFIAVALTGGVAEYDVKYELRKGAFKVTNYITGESNTSTTHTAYTMTRNLVLFAQNYNTAIRYSGQTKFYSFQYYDKDDKLICDLIPCYRKSDGEIGMYDAARKIFLTNAGTGSFTKGADV